MLNSYIGVRLSETDKRLLLEMAGSKRKLSATIRKLIRDQAKRQETRIQPNVQPASSQVYSEAQKTLI